MVGIQQCRAPLHHGGPCRLLPTYNMQTRPQSWSTTSTTFTWTVGTCTSLVLLGDRLILIGLRYSLEMEVRRLNSVGAVVWTGALFLCSSVWRPSYCDCLISHRCECRRWSATLLRSLCDKQLPNKHIQSGAPISWSRRTGLKSSGGWGGGGRWLNCLQLCSLFHFPVGKCSIVYISPADLE